MYQKMEGIIQTSKSYSSPKGTLEPFRFNYHHSAVHIDKRRLCASYMEYYKSDLHLSALNCSTKHRNILYIAVPAASEVFAGKVVWSGL